MKIERGDEASGLRVDDVADGQARSRRSADVKPESGSLGTVSVRSPEIFRAPGASARECEGARGSVRERESKKSWTGIFFLVDWTTAVLSS